ncbi:hypothetical protein [Mycolicibacterium peregrinum]|uniref:Uncharacterized protein n=1 Tax=Mycolicibacterium peregrinum TaxID=43304 RepID=A0A1A0W9A4_MYCPR|nr:hypothetical protein [Mycolicibacterium peregrinum]OBB92918.1 hypothetical protein A5779_21405 [Mycolicibacterium peregrinum]
MNELISTVVESRTWAIAGLTVVILLALAVSADLHRRASELDMRSQDQQFEHNNESEGSR